MRMTLLLPILFTLFIEARPNVRHSTQQTSKLTISSKSISIGKLFQSIKKQTGFEVFYSNQLLDDSRIIAANYKNADLSEVLTNALKGTNVTWIIQDSVILLKKETPVIKTGMAEIREKEPIPIKGRVVDEKGMPLVGVSVQVKNGSGGVSTGNDGSFKLIIPDSSAVLIFSYLGYTTQEIALNQQRREWVVELVPADNSLKSVVVVGYGTSRKRDLSGSVASVSAEQIKNQVVTGFDQALKGQAAGVQVIQSSGAPGSSVTVRVRGEGSISAGNDPLYVIDGFPVSGGARGTTSLPVSNNPLNSINPADIESIDILKDASATAIYGSRGANGVVIVTTKSGKTGKTKITFDGSWGVQQIAKKVDVLNAEEFAEFHIESRQNGWIQSGGNPNTPNAQRGSFIVVPIYTDPSRWVKTDWQDQIFRKGSINNYNLAFNGGNENIRYSVSGGYFLNEGIIIGTQLKRYSLKVNLDAKINDRWSLGVRFTPSYVDNDETPTEGQFASGGLVGTALRLAPIIGPYNADGTYTNPLSMRTPATLGSLGAVDNPVAKALEDKYNFVQTRALGNIFTEYKITKDLKFKATIGVDANYSRTHQFLSSKTGRTATAPPSIPSGFAESGQEIEWLNEELLTYSKRLNENNNLTVIAGFSAQNNQYKYLRVTGTNYPNDNVQYVAAAGSVISGSENENQSSLVSWFSRINYELLNKFLFTATFRRDASSRFGSDNKYGSFPSGAIAWRVSDEKFMKHVDFISNLKLRASYGISGNNGIPNYAFIPNLVNGSYVLGSTQTVVNATYAGRLANPGITWETKKTINFGLDLGLFNNRIDFTADVYKSNTDGLLLNVNIPAISGFSTSLENIGEVENTGLELAVNSRNLIGAFKWNTGFNISFNRNKVIALGQSAGDFIDVTNNQALSRTVVGAPMGRFYLRVTDGIFNSIDEINKHPKQDNVPQPGDRRFKDVNGDGVVNNNDLDFVGDPNPDFYFGFNNTFSYKSFDLSVSTYGTYGNDVYYNYAVGANLNGNLNQDGVIRGRWKSPTEPGSGNIPKAVFGAGTFPDVPSDFFIIDGSFLRVSNITLGYQLPLSIVKRMKISNARFYFSAQNPFIITQYPGYDPELGAGGGNALSKGIDAGIYPMSKSYSLGVNLSL